MANPYHQWKISGISPKRLNLLGFQRAIETNKKSAPKFGALSNELKNGLVEDVSQTKLHSPYVCYTSGSSVSFSNQARTDVTESILRSAVCTSRRCSYYKRLGRVEGLAYTVIRI